MIETMVIRIAKTMVMTMVNMMAWLFSEDRTTPIPFWKIHLRDIADMSAVSGSRHVCCVTQQTCLLCATADMSAVSHSRHVCCVTQETCLPCQTADISTASHSRHVCCVTQQPCLPCDTADMSPVWIHTDHLIYVNIYGSSITWMNTYCLSNICMNIYGSSPTCMNMCGSSKIWMGIYGTSNTCMNMYESTNILWICMEHFI